MVTGLRRQSTSKLGRYEFRDGRNMSTCCAIYLVCQQCAWRSTVCIHVGYGFGFAFQRGLAGSTVSMSFNDRALGKHWEVQQARWSSTRCLARSLASDCFTDSLPCRGRKLFNIELRCCGFNESLLNNYNWYGLKIATAAYRYTEFCESKTTLPQTIQPSLPGSL